MKWLPLALLLGLGGLLACHSAAAAIDWADGTGAAANPGADLGSASYSTWSLQGDRVIVRFLLPVADAERITASDIEVVVQQRMGDYLLSHLGARAAGVPCTAIDQGYDIGRVDPLTVAAGMYGFEIFFQCGQSGTAAQPMGVTLEDHALFERLPAQVNFAQVQIGQGALCAQLFTRARQQLPLPPQGLAAPAGAGRYFGLGFSRLLGRWDRLCFLLGSALLLRRTREAIPWLTALGAGLVLSLPATLLANLVPRGQLAGSAIGLLIALLAGQLLARGLPRLRPAVIATVGALLSLAALALIAHGRWPALLLAGGGLFGTGILALDAAGGVYLLRVVPLPAVFGFLSGFVLAAALTPLQLPARERLTMLMGFDLGALLGAAATVGVALLLRKALLRGSRSNPSARLHLFATDCATAALGGLGVFWMLSRLHG